VCDERLENTTIEINIDFQRNVEIQTLVKNNRQQQQQQEQQQQHLSITFTLFPFFDANSPIAA
jgi:hypothetical protein